MRKNLSRYLLILSFTLFINAVEAQTQSFKSAFDTLAVSNQFEHLYSKSNSFEEYKVISKSGYNLLKKNSLDSIQMYKQEADSHLQEINALKSNLNSTNSEIANLKGELTSTQQLKDSISFLGANISKGSYNAIVWGLIIALALLSVVLFSMFKRGHQVVKSTKARLAEVQEDLEKLRKNALVREQKLARELMDYKLKHKPNR